MVSIKWLYFRPKKMATRSNDSTTTMPMGRLHLNFLGVKKKSISKEPSSLSGCHRGFSTELSEEHRLKVRQRMQSDCSYITLYNTQLHSGMRLVPITVGEEISEGLFDVQTNKTPA